MREANEEVTAYRGAPGPLGAPWWVVLPSELPSGAFLAHLMSSGPKKSLKKFDCVWNPFRIDFMWCKKHAENSNWH